MRQDIIDAVNSFDNLTLLDVAYTFKFITNDELQKSICSGILPSKSTKSYIKKRALADEEIAEYVLISA